MGPAEFWQTTIAETLLFIQEKARGALVVAWNHAVLAQSRKLPKRPEELWGEKEKRSIVSLDTMLAMITATDPKTKD